MPKSLLEQPPQIVAQRHQQAERTVESLENHQWARLQPHANPPTTTAPALDCLVYISSATGLATNTKLAYMLKNARRYNRTQKITGVLLFDEGNFMQYLEGPRTSIDELYVRIQRDPLHTGIFEMIRESIDHRMFAEWNMGFKAFNTPSMQHLESSPLDMKNRIYLPQHHVHFTAALLLRGFWERSLRQNIPDNNGCYRTAK